MNFIHRRLCRSDLWRGFVHAKLLPWVLRDLALGDDVLEIGPGPGMTTDLLRNEVLRLTAVELDDELATALTARFAGTNVEVVNADATEMPFNDGRFTGAVSLTMLHHVPTAELQDRLFTEVARVLRPGSQFLASDGVASNELAAFHHDDIYNPIDPDTLADRLAAAGFTDVEVRTNAFGWAARGQRTRSRARRSRRQRITSSTSIEPAGRHWESLPLRQRYPDAARCGDVPPA
jgi:SAM-dependent methyltransferase